MSSLRILGVLGLAVAGGLLAQDGAGPAGAARPLVPRANGPKKPAVPPRLRGQAAAGMVNPLDRWNQMQPQQRERALAKLPPERQRLIRDRLERFNSLPKAEQDRLRSRFEVFSQLPPEQQDLVRRDMQAFNRLPPDRRPLVRREIAQLRRLPEPGRRARIASEEFHARYTPEEQQILSDLSDNMALPPK